MSNFLNIKDCKYRQIEYILKKSKPKNLQKIYAFKIALYLCMIRKLLCLTLVLSQISCGDDNNYIPETYVNFSILASEIGGVGNGIYTSSIYGVNGIIIYHKDINQYIAYERTCSYDPSESCAIVDMNDIYNPTLLVDSCCGSKFLIEDGTAFDGPALLPLKQYQTNFDGVYINVFN